VNIFFDLDGTLIDSRTRLYQLFQFLVPNSQLQFEEYWELKRNKINHKEILTTKFNYSVEDFRKFEQKWMAEIELKRWLDLDKPFEGITEFLIDLSDRNALFLVTARQSEKMVLQQIKKFGWGSIFIKVLVSEQKQEKYDLIKTTVKVNPDDWFVGDTGKDIQTGKLLGIKTAAVLSGFLNNKSLLQYEPDVIANTVLNFSTY